MQSATSLSERNSLRDWAKHPNALALFSADPGDRVRLLIKYAGSWRALLWIKVGSDGSIYAAPRITGVASVKKGTKELHGGEATIKYGEGDPVLDPETLRNPKVSFHASGLIRAGGDRLKGPSLKELTGQRMLCQFLLEHPRVREPIDKVRRRDICLDYPVQENRPLFCGLIVSSLESLSPAMFEKATHCSRAAVQFSGLGEVPDLFVQMALWHGPAGSWPPETFGYSGQFDS